MFVDTQFGITSIGDSMDAAPQGTEESQSVKMKHLRKLHEGTTKFPKLEECAHFHYETVELGDIQVYRDLFI